MSPKARISRDPRLVSMRSSEPLLKSLRQLVGVYSVCPRWFSYHFAIQLRRDVTDHLALTRDLPDPWTLTDQGSLKVGLAIAEIPTVWFSHACDIVVLEWQQDWRPLPCRLLTAKWFQTA